MIRNPKPALLLSTCAVALAACTAPGGEPRPNTTGGAVIGGIIGGIIGGQTGGDKKTNVLVGTAIGATVGGLVGQELDRQAEALRASMESGEISIVNTGSELVVTLPESITFDTGSAVLRPSLQQDLVALAANLNDFPNTTVDIIGHTDNVGPAGSNQELSARRADSVYTVLLNSGVASSRMRAFGRGESEPKASNLSVDGRARNRRVEIIIRPMQ